VWLWQYATVVGTIGSFNRGHKQGAYVDASAGRLRGRANAAGGAGEGAGVGAQQALGMPCMCGAAVVSMYLGELLGAAYGLARVAQCMRCSCSLFCLTQDEVH
jgi:hypothetical protein